MVMILLYIGAAMNPDNTTQRVFAFIRDYQAKNRRPPTVREIGAALDLAPSTVARHLHHLETQRKIAREPRRARGIRILRE
jgi:SOS-response transcriptional repressor LexA